MKFILLFVLLTSCLSAFRQPVPDKFSFQIENSGGTIFTGSGTATDQSILTALSLDTPIIPRDGLYTIATSVRCLSGTVIDDQCRVELRLRTGSATYLSAIAIGVISEAVSFTRRTGHRARGLCTIHWTGRLSKGDSIHSGFAVTSGVIGTQFIQNFMLTITEL